MIDGISENILPTWAIFIRPGEVHEFESTRDGEFLVIDFNDMEISERVSRVDRFRSRLLTFSHWRYLMFLAGEIRHSATEAGSARPLLKAAIDLLFETDIPPADQIGSPKRLQHSIDLLLKSSLTSAKLPEIAKQIGMSDSSFRRMIENQYGKSPKEIQLEYRYNHAISLLGTTDSSISAIAYAIGYENISTFTNSFRKRFGITPSQFRKAEKSKKKMESLKDTKTKS